MYVVSRLIAFGLILVLSACAPRAQLVFAPDLTADLPTRSVFVATTRRLEDGELGAYRRQSPTFLRYDISIPPARDIGEVSYAGQKINADTQFLAKSRAFYATRDDFRRDLRNALLHSRATKEAVIYVHGFNNTFDEGVLRITQLAEDFNIGGVALHYSWPSAGNVLNYAYDRDSVLFGRDGLDQLITEVKAAGADTIVIVAHSVGSHLTMEVLRQRAIQHPGSVAKEIDGVILISPDIDVDLFRAQALRIGKLPDAFGIFVSKRDRALQLSARLTGQRNRLGNVGAVAVADLDVTLVDVTEFSKGAGHFTLGDSPALINIFGSASSFAASFLGDSASRVGLLPGTILTFQSATEIILTPLTVLSQ